MAKSVQRKGKLVIRFSFFLLVVGMVSSGYADPPGFADLPLTGLSGQQPTLREFAESHELTVVVFLGTECPLAKLYANRLSELVEDFPQVAFVGVNSNSQDSLEEISAYARRHATAFTMLKDVGNRLADAMGAQRTPEAFLFDSEWEVRYQGRIDDQYGVGYARDKANREDLRIAIEELLAGEEVAQPRQEAVGCIIGRHRTGSSEGSVTYTQHVSRILQRHCLECHRDGEIAPFSLSDYDEVAGWSETIAEVIRDKRMPPWHANPAHGRFKNERLMSDEDKQLIYDWVQQGTPEGDPALLPPKLEFVSGWQLPQQPDLVVDMRKREYEIPPDGIVEYQYFVVDPGFREEKWVRAAEVIPGNREIVHHCIVFVRPPNAESMRGFGWLAAYVPGQMPLILPDGLARRVPAGSKFVFQMHYTPNGSPQLDRTKLGMVFADADRVNREVITLAALNRRFEIPPQAADYQVETVIDWLPSSGEMVAMGPHMHLRGKTFRFVAESPSGKEVLLDVPNYDFNWQHTYQLQTPKPIDDIGRIRCIATFDNSENNLVNPDPTAYVTWGDQTYEEMMVGFIDVAVDRDEELQLPWEDDDEQASMADRRGAAEAFIARFDKNRDGKVLKKEVATSFAIFAFRRLDSNDDGQITFDEALALAD